MDFFPQRGTGTTQAIADQGGMMTGTKVKGSFLSARNSARSATKSAAPLMTQLADSERRTETTHQIDLGWWQTGIFSLWNICRPKPPVTSQIITGFKSLQLISYLEGKNILICLLMEAALVLTVTMRRTGAALLTMESQLRNLKMKRRPSLLPRVYT